MLTTQKVSHPPVRPKYGAFAPARLLLNTAMAQWAVNVEHEHKRLNRDEKEKTEGQIRRWKESDRTRVDVIGLEAG